MPSLNLTTPVYSSWFLHSLQYFSAVRVGVEGGVILQVGRKSGNHLFANIISEIKIEIKNIERSNKCIKLNTLSFCIESFLKVIKL